MRHAFLREFFWENFVGDLEYHPRRAVLYLSPGLACICFWIFTSTETKFTVFPLIFLLGSLTLLLKGVFLFRKSSESLGLSQLQRAELSKAFRQKNLPSIPRQAAQILQDFGTGPFLLWPLLNIGESIDRSWSNPTRFAVFITGAILFSFGWLIGRLTSRTA